MKLNLLVAASFLLVVPTAVFSQPRTGESAPLAPESVEPSAAYEQGRALLAGDGVPKDEKKAFKLMKEAADKNHLPAIAGVAYLYSAGMGVAKDPVEAAKWFRLAAEKEHAISRYNLGKLLVADEIPLPEGTVDRKTQHAEGVEWFRKAADQGFNEARASYGIILFRGDFETKRDPAAAAGYLQPAAEAGNLEAMNTLGVMHRTGNGVTRDPSASERLFRQAAMAGHVKAQANLGEHLNPLSQNPDQRIEALAWLYIAEESEDPVAKKLLAIKLQAVSPDDVTAGKKKAAEIQQKIREEKK